jgi:hypothetical protein
MIFYSKTKGQLEDAVISLGIPSVYIFRPSLLLGDRKEERIGEKLGTVMDKLFSPIMIGGLKKYKGIEAFKVAQNMVHYAINIQKGVHIYENDEMLEL